MLLQLLLLLGPIACGPDAPPPVARAAASPAVLRLATWNVHDLFDEVDRLDPPGALDEVPGAAEVEARLEQVASVLAALDADAVLLQEVEHQPLLARLAARCGYPEARLLEGNDPRGIDLGLLSRLPVVAYLGHADDLAPDGRRLWPRDAVEAVLDAGGRRLAWLGTHLSSRLSDPAGSRRSLQAARLRALADLAGAKWGAAMVVVGGDLNDEASAASLAPLLGDGAWLGAEPGAGSDAWTWSDGASRAALDHLLVRAVDAGAILSARVVGGSGVAVASDHRPVVLDLLMP
jgi:endonuclease/exonuclease/phosphatase family metal-dependent hydrolase